MPSATGDTGAEQQMRAWKFLDTGRIAPFGGHTWPAPTGDAPGDWVRFPGREIFACRLEDLPWWIAAELWEVELEPPVRALETQLAAAAGRLLRRVAGWDGQTLRAYGAAAAERARELAIQSLTRDGRTEEAQALARARSMLELSRVAAGYAGEGGVRLSANLAGYVAESSMRASEGAAAAAANIAANAAVIALADPSAFHRERQWQARWIAEHAGLTAVPVAAV
ncbi:MAG TPA: hypothetical protein VFI53_18500 [Myxococcaceae bacterium]|nr:hypothetical protein [Myxococcaceae bacterium]